MAAKRDRPKLADKPIDPNRTADGDERRGRDGED